MLQRKEDVVLERIKPQPPKTNKEKEKDSEMSQLKKFHSLFFMP